MNKKTDVIIIKKYSNRRLYNTQISQYITHNDLLDAVKNDQAFKIIDATTKEDITKIVLTQIIFEQEQKGCSLFPEILLRQLIKCYGTNIGEELGKFLSCSVDMFFENPNATAEKNSSSGDYSPIKIFSEITKKNMEIFGKSMSIFAHTNSDDEKND